MAIINGQFIAPVFQHQHPHHPPPNQRNHQSDERGRVKKDWRFWTIFSALLLVAFISGRCVHKTLLSLANGVTHTPFTHHLTIRSPLLTHHHLFIPPFSCFIFFLYSTGLGLQPWI